MIKAYKGFNRDMTCRGFQYEEGKEYETDKAEFCESGFHACLDPLDCFGYYSPSESVYHEVEIEDNGQRHNEDSKVVGKKIKIGARLSVADICKLHFEFVKEHCEPAKSNAAGDNESASAGNYGSASAGNFGSASAGNRGSASAGNFGSASAGNYGSAVSRGTAEVGKNGVAIVRGDGCRIKGGIGSYLAIAEEMTDSYEIRFYKAFKIDGKRYKADTWYKLDENGKVVKCDD